MTGVNCPPGCTCLRHRERSAEERARQGELVRAAAARRRKLLTPQLGNRVHRRCLRCNRLLVPDDYGHVPLHRKPRRSGQLTGMDSPWCPGKAFA